MKSVGLILARLQPIHNGHLALIEKACQLHDEVVVMVGSCNQHNSRNPIPIQVRMDLTKAALAERFGADYDKKIKVMKLPDLTDETDDSHDWGFYLYSNVVDATQCSCYSHWYSDGYEKITSWYPGWVQDKYVSLMLLARGGVESGVSATKVRNDIMSMNYEELKKEVPQCVYDRAQELKLYIEMFSE